MFDGTQANHGGSFEVGLDLNPGRMNAKIIDAAVQLTIEELEEFYGLVVGPEDFDTLLFGGVV